MPKTNLLNKNILNPLSSIRWLISKLRIRYSTLEIESFISTIAELTETKPTKVRSIYTECVDGGVIQNYRTQVSEQLNDDIRERISRKIVDSVKSARLDRIALYIVVRLTKPEIVVETGVGTGQGSLFILEALNKNNVGKLYSFDAGIEKMRDIYDIRHDVSEVGWVVNESLRDRWELVIGDSVKEMSSTLPKIPPIDLFYHDSLHEYEHMLSEYQTAIEYIKESGILMSEDTHLNQAWEDFIKSNKNIVEGNYKYYSLPGIQNHREISATVLKNK